MGRERCLIKNSPQAGHAIKSDVRANHRFLVKTAESGDLVIGLSGFMDVPTQHLGEGMLAILFERG
jgi:hypothetical protein